MMSDLTAFHQQVKTGNLEGVRRTLTDDPSLLDAKNEAGQSALLLSKYYGREDVAAHLLSLHPALDVYSAAAVGDTERVMSEIDRDPSLIESYSSDGWTPLHVASFFGQQMTAEKLIERGANLEARSTNAMKNTPLHAAAAGRKLGLVKLLLDAGANANARQEGGWTALHAAAQNGDREIVELLIAHGADMNARADNNQGALDLALMKGRQDVAEFLSELGARLE